MSLTDASMKEITCNFWNVREHYLLIASDSSDIMGCMDVFYVIQTTFIYYKIIMKK